MQPTYNQTSYYEKQAQKYPYIEAKDYSDFESIFETFPHLKNINKPFDCQNKKNVNGIIIRSANDDNVHKAIKYGIWTTTVRNRERLDALWQRNNAQTPKHETYLFFSVVKSGMFEGVARLASGMYDETFPFWWENHTLKFKGVFKIEWVYLKDVNYKHFDGLTNTQGDDVTKSKDCDNLDPETTLDMIEIYSKRPSKRTIFSDFKYMDERQKKYIRPLYDQTIEGYRAMENPYHGYQQMSMMNYMPMGHNMMGMGQNPMMPPPMTIPGGNTIAYNPINKSEKTATLGFQKNPVSKNRKK